MSRLQSKNRHQENFVGSRPSLQQYFVQLNAFCNGKCDHQLRARAVSADTHMQYMYRRLETVYTLKEE